MNKTLTKFQQLEFDTLHLIPKGRVVSYKELAKKIGREGASRAVGTALSLNSQPVIVPCHRVVKTNGELGNYTFNGTNQPTVKRDLLVKEGVFFRDDGRVERDCFFTFI